jgi:hypothetical protein
MNFFTAFRAKGRVITLSDSQRLLDMRRRAVRARDAWSEYAYLSRVRHLENLPFANSYARLPPAFYEVVDPTPLPDPYLVAFNPDAAALLDLDPGVVDDPNLPLYLSGSKRIPGAEPIAEAYAGHQFGVWVPQLGDGRAFLLGQVRNGAASWDLHLKGGGRTRFSRFGDGRAVLRSVIREYLASEAMHGLGIPTSRALSIVASDLPVQRETVETAATLIRLAPTHVRFGTFELFASRGEAARIRELADFVIDHHFPELAGEPDRVRRLFGVVTRRTGMLMAQWMAAGFAHGVMNTDNMSILGLTLDYGPYGFLDDYDPDFICNHTDVDGRYSFGHQPGSGCGTAPASGRPCWSRTRRWLRRLRGRWAGPRAGPVAGGAGVLLGCVHAGVWPSDAWEARSPLGKRGGSRAPPRSVWCAARRPCRLHAVLSGPWAASSAPMGAGPPAASPG